MALITRNVANDALTSYLPQNTSSYLPTAATATTTTTSKNIITRWITNSVPMRWASSLVYNTYFYLILNPLANLYLRGPSIHGYGFWSGKTMPEICAELTNVPSEFWERNPLECQDLVSHQFESFVVAVETVIYIVLLYRLTLSVAHQGWHWLTNYRPMDHWPFHHRKEAAVAIPPPSSNNVEENHHHIMINYGE